MEAVIKFDTSEVSSLLRQLTERMDDLTPAMADISDVLYHIVTDNIEAGGRPRWKRLKPSTLAQREKKGYVPAQIMKQTGQLYASITPYHTDKSAGVGTNKKYAKTHHYGAKKGAFGKFSVTQQVREHLRKGKRIRAHARQTTISVRGSAKLGHCIASPGRCIASPGRCIA